MSTQKLDPDHKRKMVGGVLAAALLFAVVIGAKLNTGQLSAQVGGEHDEPDGCYFKLIDSTGAEAPMSAGLAWCDETGCYFPDGYWNSSGTSGTGANMTVGTYKLEANVNSSNYGTLPVGSDGKKYRSATTYSTYEVNDGDDVCRDKDGVPYEDYEDDDDYVDDDYADDDYVDDEQCTPGYDSVGNPCDVCTQPDGSVEYLNCEFGNVPAFDCEEEDRGNEICEICYDAAGVRAADLCWQKDNGDEGKADPKDAARQLKDMQKQVSDHTKFNLPEYKRFLSGGDFKDYSGKAHKNPGRLAMIRENLNRDLKRNTKLAEMMTEAGISTAELDLDSAWTKERLSDIDFIEAELKALISQYEADIQTVKPLIDTLDPENVTWEELNVAWFTLQKKLDPYWTVRDGIDGVISFTERSNEIADWTFEYRKAMVDLKKFGGDAYLDEQLLAELEEIAREGAEVKNVVVEAVEWYQGLKGLADDVWTLAAFGDNWHEQLQPMRDRQQEFGWWRNDIQWTFDDWRCVEEGGENFGGDLEDDFDEDFDDFEDFDDDFDDFGDDDFDDFDEDFDDDDFDDDFEDFGGGPGFCEMDVWRFLDELRMSADHGREAGFMLEEIKFMLEALRQMKDLPSMIDTDDLKVLKAIDQLVRIAGEATPIMEKVLEYMEAGEFEKAEKTGREVEEIGGEAEKWAEIIMSYCDDNPKRCELTPEVDELIYGGPGDFEEDPGDHRDYLEQVYVDEDLIEKIVNELLSKFADDLANKLVQQFAEAFSEAEMNKLITAMVDEAIEKTMSTVFNYFDAYGDEKSKILVENSSAVYGVISKIEGLGDMDDAVKKLLAQIKEKPVASTVKDKLASALNELYDAISNNEDIDATLSSIEKLVAMNEEELIISDGFGYKDVKPEDGDWYAEHVLRASAGDGCEAMFKGDTNADGSKKGTFRPGDPIAKIEMLKVGLAASGNCLKGGTGDKWYAPYVEAGVSAGLRIAAGRSVEDKDMGYWATPATREELAWLIYELGANAGKYDFADADIDKYGFPDVDKNSDLAKVAAILKKEEIITGTGDGLFNAGAQTNRAEASKVFTKFRESVEKSIF